MKTFKFETTISKDGVVHIPDNFNLKEENVEIIIFTKKKYSKKKINTTEFIDRWAGFLKNKNIDRSKSDYLYKKYK
jgi:hypothetical protein